MIRLVCVALLLVGCPRPEEDHQGHEREPHKAEHKEHNKHKEHEHEAREHDERYDATLLSRLRDRRCEHKVKILDCAECRYEVGAVELAAKLVKQGLIRTARATKAAKQGRLRLTGEVAFDERRVVHVSPRIRGVARRVFVTTGDVVKAGAPLFEMDSLELGKLRSRYLQAKANLELARQNHEREQRLHEDKISSKAERIQSETTHRQAKIELKAAAEQLRLIGLGAAGGGGRMTVRSPRAGVVVDKHVVPGERLTPDKQILTVADLSTVWVWAHSYERDLSRLLAAKAAGKLKAEVAVAAFADKTFAGTVDYVGATMEEATRTVKVRVVVPNAEGLLRPGMFASVGVALGKKESGEALFVPGQAVVADGAERFVFVRIGERRFLRRDVQTGERSGETVEVTRGLTAGEEIVVHGAFLLKSDILREKMGAGCAD